MALSPQDAFLQQIYGQAPVEEPKSCIPYLLIGVGGTGAEVLRRVKWRASLMGMEQVVRFLVIDTSRRAKKPLNRYPGFEDHEFVYLEPDPVRVLLDNLDLTGHRDIIQRLSLTDRSILKQVRDFARAGHDGAGQVRRNGLLRFYGNYEVFLRQLKTAIKHLTGRWKQLRTDRDDLGAFNAFIIGSVCGGTGAGIFLDVAAAAKASISKIDADSKLMAILTLPEVYDFVTGGKRNDFIRIRANAYATLQELEYLRHASAEKHNTVLTGRIKTPQQDIFAAVSLVSRIDSEGQDLRTDEAVFDAIALYLSAFIGQMIQDFTLDDMCNDHIQIEDPRLRRPLHYGSIAATALTMPVGQLLLYCASRRAAAFAAKRLIGFGRSEEEIDKTVTGWLENHHLEERGTRDDLLERLKAAANFDATRVRAVLLDGSGSKARHFADKIFIGKVNRVRDRWNRSEAAQLGRKLDALIDPVVQEAEGAMKARAEELAREEGLEAANRFLRRLAATLQDIKASLTREAEADIRAEKKAGDEVVTKLAPLQTFLGRLGTDESRQNAVIRAVEAQVHYGGMARVKRAASKIISALFLHCERLTRKVSSAIDRWRPVHAQLEEWAAESRIRDVNPPFGDSYAELSAITKAWALQFYNDHPVSDDALIDSLESAVNASLVDWLLSNRATHRAAEFIRLVAGHRYREEINKLDISEELERDPQSEYSREIRSRLEATIKSCNAMWNARPVEAGGRFEDGMVIAHSKKAGTVLNEVIEKCKSAIGGSPLYGATPESVVVHDSLRIYAVRRCAGGLPYHLPQWMEYRTAYEEWTQKTSPESIHCFPPSVVDRLPPMEPFAATDAGERAFVLALAFGWIAQRGRYYYFNLAREAGGALSVPMLSYGDGLAFRDKKLEVSSEILGRAIRAGRITYQCLDSSGAGQRIGGSTGGRSKALREFKNNPEALALVMEAYDMLAGAVDRAALAEDLDRHRAELEARLAKVPASRRQDVAHLKREIEILESESASLRK